MALRGNDVEPPGSHNLIVQLAPLPPNCLGLLLPGRGVNVFVGVRDGVRLGVSVTEGVRVIVGVLLGVSLGSTATVGSTRVWGVQAVVASTNMATAADRYLASDRE